MIETRKEDQVAFIEARKLAPRWWCGDRIGFTIVFPCFILALVLHKFFW